MKKTMKAAKNGKRKRITIPYFFSDSYYNPQECEFFP